MGCYRRKLVLPENEGYHIEQEACSFANRVNRMNDWTRYGQGLLEAWAYWAVCTNNNSSSINGELLKVLKFVDEHRISYVSAPSCSTRKVKIIKSSEISSRKIGLTPQHVGTIVEPPFVS